MTANEYPLVSVIIPTYNHSNYLRRALQTVLDQTYANWEAIVIDNHSSDNTDEVIGGFSDSRITFLKIHNSGVIAASRNMGIRAARGEWIAFLDSDDWWGPDKLLDCVGYMNDRADVIYHDLEVITDPPARSRKGKLRTRQVNPPVLMDLLMHGNALSNSSVVVRRKLLVELGEIDENPEMIACEDYNMWLRIAKSTNRFIYLPQSLGYYLIHDQAVSKKDMSIPERVAVEEFLCLLDDNQAEKVEARIRYAKGRFSYISGKYLDARDSLGFSLRYGASSIKLRSAYFLMAVAYELLIKSCLGQQRN